MKSLSNAGTTTVNANSILRTARLGNLGNITVSPTGQIIIGTGPDVIGGGLAQYTNGIWNEQLSPSSFGVMDVNGPMSLNGTLDIMLLNGFLPTAGETFTIANFTPGQLSGMWASILGLNFDHGLFFWDINYDNNNGEIILTAEQKLTPNDLSAVPEPATWIMMFSGIACWGARLKASKRVDQEDL